MRAEDLVEAEDVVVDLQCLHVDLTVRRVRHAIDDDLGAPGMHMSGDLRYRVDRPEYV